MECNKEEAAKAMELGHKFMQEGELARADKFLKKAKEMYPLPGIEALIAEIEKLMAQHGMVDKVLQVKNYYEMLNVTVNASIDDIKQAYKRLALQLHPDKNKAPGASQAFQAIKTAYDCLLDPTSRAKYNQENKPGVATSNAQQHPFASGPKECYNAQFKYGLATYNGKRVVYSEISTLQCIYCARYLSISNKDFMMSGISLENCIFCNCQFYAIRLKQSPQQWHYYTPKPQPATQPQPQQQRPAQPQQQQKPSQPPKPQPAQHQPQPQQPRSTHPQQQQKATAQQPKPQPGPSHQSQPSQQPQQQAPNPRAPQQSPQARPKPETPPLQPKQAQSQRSQQPHSYSTQPPIHQHFKPQPRQPQPPTKTEQSQTRPQQPQPQPQPSRQQPPPQPPRQQPKQEPQPEPQEEHKLPVRKRKQPQKYTPSKPTTQHRTASKHPTKRHKSDEQVEDGLNDSYPSIYISSDSDAEPEAEYEVEAILDAKPVGRKKVEYLIKWAGYDSSHNSWEPEENLNCEQKLEEFWAKRDGANVK